jgi:hypothetical protein
MAYIPGVGMELLHEKNRIIIEDKAITAIDTFVLDFTSILRHYTEYVIVSGYVVILFGRVRGTEDIDTLLKYLDKPRFLSLYNDLMGNRYYFLNPEDEHGLYEMLQDGLGIRAAKEHTIIPNIEMKFAKDDYDRYALDNRLDVAFGGSHVFVSPVELQIPYKLYLGSKKDIEDAVYLWDLFKENLDMTLLNRFMENLQVRGAPYGIGF